MPARFVTPSLPPLQVRKESERDRRVNAALNQLKAQHRDRERARAACTDGWWGHLECCVRMCSDVHRCCSSVLPSNQAP